MGSHQITVVRYDVTDPRLGRHVEHDSRSWEHALLPKTAKPQKKTTHWSSRATVLNQGNLGSCTGNATAQFLNTDFASAVQANKNGGRQFVEDDAVRIYSKATHLDNAPGAYPPDDTGSSGNAACKAAKGFGWLKSYSWLFSFTSTQAAAEKQPLMFGTLWTNTMFNPTNGLVKVGRLVDSNIAGGHEYLCSGIDWEEEVFEFRNSWGDTEDWPGCKPGGYFAIGFKDVQTLLDNQGDVTVPHWS